MALPQDGAVRGDSPLSGFPDWAWIALTITAASLQAFRTAAQKWLGGRLTTDAATYVRYLFAWPVAAGFALILAFGFDTPPPMPDAAAWAWAATAAISQIGGTFFLLKALESRNFAVGVAYSKTDVVQAALFEAAALGASVTWGAAAGMGIATAAVIAMSMKTAPAGQGRLAALATGLFERSALYGLASGASLAVSGVTVRGTVVSLTGPAEVNEAAAAALAMVLTLQVVVMGAWLAYSQPRSFGAIARSWRPALLAGLAGGFGSICWFLALGLQQVAYVRTLGLIEIVATVALSRFLFKEHTRLRDLIGIAALLAGIALVLNAG